MSAQGSVVNTPSAALTGEPASLYPGWTVAATLIFGLFGAAAAAAQASLASSRGLPTSRYWRAFGLALLAGILIQLALGVLILGAVGIITDVSWAKSLLLYSVVAAAAVGFGALADLPLDRARARA